MTPTKIQSPVRGEWKFMNPPGHHPDAKDFVAVDQGGKPYKPLKLILHLFYKLSVAETYSWEKEVFAPFAGRVIALQNTSKDRMTLNLVRDLVSGLLIAPKKNHGVEYFLGNYIVLKSDSGMYALFAHLKEGSILVEKGATVKCGDILGKIGNSGNTIQPHLHFQVMKGNDPATSLPIPFIFEHFQSCNGSRRNVATLGLPKDYQQFRA